MPSSAIVPVPVAAAVVKLELPAPLPVAVPTRVKLSEPSKMSFWLVPTLTVALLLPAGRLTLKAPVASGVTTVATPSTVTVMLVRL